ncbi:thiol reductant ABC exporter subunit CydC [Motilimonas pumila]|uniref:Thiol reductant ABC exporter subunit CydC n=1 Tax=Motilimonas pumila TaxID=2303987 RepID=A0A418YFJ9_9GAMM|nr:thiol reductant ABC exporter subunit CydC [Motilimonas pumila]RJG48166.1 thiol reductant ABC exporter subunit CydC [Motilimonas pumila]
MNEFLRLCALMRPQLGWMLLGALVSLLSLLANISLLAVSGWFLTIMAMAGLTGASINYFTPGAIVRFLAIVRTVGKYAERLVTHQATFKVIAHLRVHFYRQLEPLIPYHQLQLRSGDLMSRMQQDIDHIDNFYLRILLPLTLALISVPLVCSAVAYFSPLLALWVAAALLLLGLGIPFLSYLWCKRSAVQQVALTATLKLQLVDSVSAIKEVLVYQLTGSYQQQINRVSQELYQVELALHRRQTLFESMSFILINMMVLISLLITVPLAQQGHLAPEYIASLALLILVCVETVLALPLAMQLLPATLASARRLFEIMDKSVPQESEHPEGSAVENAVLGEVAFKRVSFSYPDAKEPVLKNINLSLQPGEKVAIIGASGAGKSTLVNLLMGFWPIEQGQLTIAGVPIAKIKAQELRQYTALMSQSGHVFKSTIADNLRLAQPNMTETQMHSALDSAGLKAWIASLPDGVNTWLGETGSGLSGGQKQRLMLAQALLRESHVLVLDEPTKGLDPLTEQSIVNKLSLHLARTQQSLIMITHKPVMLQQMDNIVVMEQGHIVAQGKHGDLLDSCAYYQDLLDYF